MELMRKLYAAVGISGTGSGPRDAEKVNPALIAFRGEVDAMNISNVTSADLIEADMKMWRRIEQHKTNPVTLAEETAYSESVFGGGSHLTNSSRSNFFSYAMGKLIYLKNPGQN